MWSRLFQHSDLLDIPVVVMLFFFVLFAVVIYMALSRRRAAHYESMARLPLETNETAVKEEVN